MEPLINLIVYVIIFGVVAYGAWWICTKFGLPAPVLWIVGAILLLVLLVFISQQLGVLGPVIPLRR